MSVGIFCGGSEHFRRAKSLENHGVLCHLWWFLNFKNQEASKININNKNMRGNTFDAFNLRSTTWSTTLRVTWRHHHRPPLETFKILILRRGSGGLLMSWSEIHGATVISSVNMRNRKN